MEKFDINTKIDQVKEVFNNSLIKADELLVQKDHLDVIADEALSQADRARNQLSSGWKSLRTFYSIVHDFIKGNNHGINKTDLRSMVGCLIYFVSPVDVFPDFIPLFGFVDDLFVIGLVTASVYPTLSSLQEHE